MKKFFGFLFLMFIVFCLLSSCAQTMSPAKLSEMEVAPGSVIDNKSFDKADDIIAKGRIKKMSLGSGVSFSIPEINPNVYIQRMFLEGGSAEKTLSAFERDPYFEGYFPSTRVTGKENVKDRVYSIGIIFNINGHLRNATMIVFHQANKAVIFCAESTTINVTKIPSAVAIRSLNLIK